MFKAWTVYWASIICWLLTYSISLLSKCHMKRTLFLPQMGSWGSKAQIERLIICPKSHSRASLSPLFHATSSICCGIRHLLLWGSSFPNRNLFALNVTSMSLCSFMTEMPWVLLFCLLLWLLLAPSERSVCSSTSYIRRDQANKYQPP